MRRSFLVIQLAVLAGAASGVDSSAWAGQYTFTTLEVPGAGWTSPSHIDNNGEIVGTFADASGTHGFVRHADGTFDIIDAPTAVTYPYSTVTQTFGSNDAGVTVGHYFDEWGNHGYVGAPGVTGSIDIRNANYEAVLAINNLGHITGYYMVPWSSGHYAFVAREIVRDQDGFLVSHTTFEYPEWAGTMGWTDPWGINDAGVIVGLARDSTGGGGIGFILEGGVFTPLLYPGAWYGDALDINNNGQVVGRHYINYRWHGFLYEKDPDGEAFVQLDYPDSWYTGATSINDDGTIVGQYHGPDYVLRGFIATPANRPPVAGADAYEVNEDTVLSVAAPGVLGDDSDPDYNPLTALLEDDPANGSLLLYLDGSFSYTPSPNFNGSDEFTYRAHDGGESSTPATVSITVNTVNDTPVAVEDAATVPEGGRVTIAVLANDTDVDGDGLVVTSVTQGAAGSVAFDADGTVTYTPARRFTGTDSFAYTVSDGHGGFDTANVAVQVASAGGGQSQAVDALIAWLSPLEQRVELAGGTLSVAVTIVYAAGIDPATFEATLNTAPFVGFSPAPGAIETVVLPLIPGRNVLVVEASGTAADGHNPRRDRDRLVFIVP